MMGALEDVHAVRIFDDLLNDQTDITIPHLAAAVGNFTSHKRFSILLVCRYFYDFLLKALLISAGCNVLVLKI